MAIEPDKDPVAASVCACAAFCAAVAAADPLSTAFSAEPDANASAAAWAVATLLVVAAFPPVILIEPCMLSCPPSHARKLPSLPVR